MCISVSYQLICTDCRKMFYDEDKNSFNESIESLKEEASELGWHCDVRVPNGSDWDFCPRCYKVFIEEQKEQ